MDLTEKENTEVDIRREEQDFLLPTNNIQMCVVAKVMAAKKVNSDAFRAVMLSIWKVHNNTKIHLAGDNLFFIQFRSMGEKLRVLSEGPWTFDRALIIFQSPKESESISNLVFSETSIWIQIHNVPFNCLSRSMALVLGNSIGRVEDIDCDDNEIWTGPFMRIRVSIDIEKPLLRGVKLRNSDVDVVWCPILYEKLPDFCHSCGIIGHSHRECAYKLSSSKEEGMSGYGEWMRASILKRNSSNRWGDSYDTEGTHKTRPPTHGRGNRLQRWGGGSRSDVDRWRSIQDDDIGEKREVKSPDQTVGDSAIKIAHVSPSKLKITEATGINNSDAFIFQYGTPLNRNETVVLSAATKDLNEKRESAGSKSDPQLGSDMSLMEVEVRDSRSKSGRIIKKYKVKTPCITGEGSGQEGEIEEGSRKRKITEAVERMSFAKKGRMDGSTSKSLSAEAVQQPRREL